MPYAQCAGDNPDLGERDGILGKRYVSRLRLPLAVADFPPAQRNNRLRLAARATLI